MKVLKLKSVFFSLTAFTILSMFLISCQKTEDIKPEFSIENQIQEKQFSKNLFLSTKDNIDVELDITSKDDFLLKLLDEKSFDVDFVYELPANDESQMTNNLEIGPINKVNPDLMISVDKIELPKNALGVKINFKQNEEISSRYDRVSTYYYSVYSYKGIATRNDANPSIKMKYYDDHSYAGYRSLCSGSCNQIAYTFGRSDVGVGCQYEYWANAYKNVSISFLP